MKTVEPRSLLDDFPLTVDISPELVKVFVIWKKKFMERTGKVPSNVDYMYAGYVLANPNVRDKFKIFKEKDIK